MRFFAAIAILLTACSSTTTSGSPSDEPETIDTADTGSPPDVPVADSADPVDTVTPTPVNTCTAPQSARVQNASVPDGFCASIWADGLSDPRGLRVMPNGDVLVVERGLSRISVLWDADGDGVSGADERAVLASAQSLNHSVLYTGGYLYASSSQRVFRWEYEPGQRTDLGEGQVVIHDIPNGGHSTRTLEARDGLLYVTVGSAGNVDKDSQRSAIRRFPIESLGATIVPYGSGELFADGLRNEVGLDFDAQGRLWGVENGVDNLAREDLGGDIHDDNPAEELNRFDVPGAFYGYPYCWSEFILPAGVGLGPNAHWAHPQFIDDGTHSDAWCQDPDNVVPPAFSLQAHSAPLDMHFYAGGSFPAEMTGDLFVPMHGSWNRPVPTGYKMVRVRFENGEPVEVLPFFEYAGEGDIATDWPHRPVAVDAGLDGQLFLSSDKSNTIFVLGYER